ncbi:MAG TPA: FHA domain-containing protein, partial [Gammaproteobacteria bacterium]|nr:FHA domain-containing protein [Gammaproteobacteria bacterium]
MEFLHAVAAAFDGMIHGNTTRELHSALLDFLIEHNIQGEQFVLAVDNAHNLSNEVLEILKSLTELESRDKRILKIAVLARNGAKINRNIRELCQSDSLNTLICEITPFTEIETRAYVAEQLAGKVEFSRLQLTATGGRRIHYYSGGNPRLINILTTLSARIALKAEQRQITRKIVQYAVQTPKWVAISEAIPGIHVVKVPGSDERGQYATPKVIVFQDEKKIAEYNLDKEKMWLGRDPSSDIRLNRQSVSRRHALITLEDGNVWISNLNSINGTQVNSKPVLRRVLLDGDVIRVANFLLLFIYEEAAHSSGHLKEATQTDLETRPELTDEEARENYFELPTAHARENDLAHAPVAQKPVGTKSRRKKSPLITVSTIASIGLITGAIVISQSGVEKFDISFPRGKSVKPTPIETLPQSEESEALMPGAPESELAATPADNAGTTEQASGLSPDQIAAMEQPSGAVPPPAEQQTNDATLEHLAESLPNAPIPPAAPSPMSRPESPAEPANIAKTVAAISVETSTPAEEIPTIEPVTNLFSGHSVQTTFDDRFVTDSETSSAPRSEAGFEDLVFASPGADNIYVRDDLNQNNSAIVSDRRNDAIDFAWNDVDDLLQKGQQQIASLKLTVPAGDNAYDTFMQVLAIDPGNAEANAGLDQIAERYLNIATASKERFNFTHALKMAQRGLHVRPNDPALNQLADELTVMAANQPRPEHGFRIEKVPESELHSRYGIARATESEFDRQFKSAQRIRRVSEQEIDALYAQSTPTFIEPVESLPTFAQPEVARSQPETPVFIQPQPAPQTFARAPAPIATPPVTTSAPVATPL